LCLCGLLEWRPLGLAVPWVKGCGGTKMQREFAMRRLAKLEGYRLEKKGDDNYRLSMQDLMSPCISLTACR